MAEKTVLMRNLKQGNYVMIDDEPCIVLKTTKAKTGRHGATRVRVEAIGIFDDKKRFLLKPSVAEVEVPVISKRDAQVISVSGDIVQLMDLQDYSTFDASIPVQFKGKLAPGTEVLYWKIGNSIMIKDVK